MKSMRLPAGITIRVGDIPVKLIQKTEVETDESNFPLIYEKHSDEFWQMIKNDPDEASKILEENGYNLEKLDQQSEEFMKNLINKLK